MLDIVFQDEHYVAINKPHGLLVHRTALARDVNTFALQLLRDQLNRPVYPAHRLDRKTSGVLLFALSEDSLSAIRKLFEAQELQKKYIAVVRGYTPEEADIDYALKNEKGISQEAFTSYKTIERTEIPVPFGKHNTSRYSLIEVSPKTGRMHQIRKHMAHVLHPIIGDRPHGCNKQNRLFLEKWNINTMFLHARELSFTHPYTDKEITIKATPQPEFVDVLKLLQFNYSI